jgi:pyruvate-formate lyase-activating enzyme
MSQAIRGVNLRNRNRMPLHAIAPLDYPLVLYLEPTNVCNFRCSFCPTGDTALIKRHRPVGMMPWELWTKVIDDFKAFDQPAENAHLFKDGESTLHPRFLDMLGYMRDAGVAKRLWIKTNGSTLSPKMNQGLIDNGMNNIGISIEHVTAEGYKRISHVKFDYEALRDNVADLYSRRGDDCKIYVKIPSQWLSQEEIDKFYADFSDRCDYIGLENFHGWSTPELGDFTMGYATNDTYDGDPMTEKIVCPWTIFAITVNWNGATSVCPEDWAWKTIIGDASKERIIDIWNGERMFGFRKMHLEGRRADNIACRGCYFMRTLPDNVDHWRGEILDRYEQRLRQGA